MKVQKITVPCSYPDMSELWSGAIFGIKSQKPLGSLTNPSWDARAAGRISVKNDVDFFFNFLQYFYSTMQTYIVNTILF